MELGNSILEKMMLRWASSSSASQWEISPTKHCSHTAKSPSTIFAQSNGEPEGSRRGGLVLSLQAALARLILASNTVLVNKNVKIILQNRTVHRRGS